MNFVDEYVEALEEKRDLLLELFGRKAPSELETNLRDLLEPHWHNLPSVESVFDEEFAVDSSSASRSVNNGLEFVIVRGLMVGGDETDIKKIFFEAMRGVPDPYVITNFERILRDLIEIQLVLENCDRLDGGLVLIDGNLYGRYTHLNKQYNLQGWEHLPLLLFEAMQRLFEICSENGLTVVGVSKFSRTRVFCNALLSEGVQLMPTPDFLDVELLYKGKNDDPGYTTPLLLGDYAFRDEVAFMTSSPESYYNRFFNRVPSEEREWGLEVIEKVPDAPATVMFHLLPEAGEQPLRVDIPANCLGLPYKMRDVSPYRFVDPGIVEDLVKQLLSDRGGRDVYNALLYVVDQEVKLSPDTVDNVYRSILGREIGLPIEYDRSSRRFYG